MHDRNSLVYDIDNIKSVVSVGAVNNAIALLDDLREKVAALEVKAEFTPVKKETRKMTELINYRCSKELTQEALAKIIGVSVSAIKHWEQGVRYPSAKSMKKINKILEGK